MARTRKMSRKKKYDWMQKRISLEWSTADMTNSDSDYADSLYIDVAQCLSILNRKLVRQGQLFRISNMQVFTDEKDSDSNDDYRLKVGTLPTNWVTRNAWVKSKALFDEMNMMASENIGSASTFPKWHDFKVYYNAGHKVQVAGSTESTVTPVDLDANAFPSGEWQYSQFSDSGTTPDEYYVHMLGKHTASGTLAKTTNSTNYDSVGLVLAYAQSRVVQQSPDPVHYTDTEISPWARLFGDDAQTVDVNEHLQDTNDDPPYDVNDYIGAGDDDAGVCMFTGRLQEGNIPVATRGIPSFIAPCGLVRLEIDASSAHRSGAINKVHITFDAEPIAPMDA